MDIQKKKKKREISGLRHKKGCDFTAKRGRIPNEMSLKNAKNMVMIEIPY